ncbi:hypothetical protein BE20_58285 [Sorangium cellulosum]|uniref:Uncharacterized protein n=1 Tax=Sorangium cellulosum TaxID=56 RepID=A0A150T4Y8_SORCE|nr:hypothetical protein BE18_12980 [Sorangium cellulosum]KYF99760.1 hypothetical protein BE20_58285 [Sorangium cellulosum]
MRSETCACAAAWMLAGTASDASSSDARTKSPRRTANHACRSGDSDRASSSRSGASAPASVWPEAVSTTRCSPVMSFSALSVRRSAIHQAAVPPAPFNGASIPSGSWSESRYLS